MKLGAVDESQGAFRAQPRERLGRLVTADDQDPAAGGHGGEPVGQHLVQAGMWRHLLVVVEHQDERRSQAAIELSEVATRERRQRQPVLGPEQRQRRARPATAWRGEATTWKKKAAMSASPSSI